MNKSILYPPSIHESVLPPRRLAFALHLASAFLFSFSLQAAVKLPSIFSDHMILQADQAAPVWGWAEPGEDVTVAVAGQSRTAKANADGKWKVILDPLKASPSGQLLTVTGTNVITIQDVLIGEVWLCSGQSNMALRVDVTLNADQEIPAANFPLIRMFTVRSIGASTPQENCEGVWLLTSPQTVGNFAATAYYFGKELHKTLSTPVGLINSSVGGTRIEAWTSAEAQRATPALKDRVAEFDKDAAAFNPEAAKAKYEKDLAAWKAKGSQGRAPMDPVASRPKLGRELGMLFNGKINPLVPFSIKGAIWYQGEANSPPARAPLYKEQLPVLIQDWRTRWGYDFPFAWVQLTNFQGGAGRDWPIMRENQLNTLSVKNTGMAITIDIGDENEIHALNKPEVGRRLGLWAVSQVYGRQGEYTGPLPDGVPAKAQVNGDKISVTLTHAEGLNAKGGEVKGFQIAGEDHAWKPATAVIDGETVVVSSPEVTKPAAVRYAWANFPDGNLYNNAGLPASPFRTVSWNDPLPPVPAAAQTDAEDSSPNSAPPASTPALSNQVKASGAPSSAPAGGNNLVKDGDFQLPINKSMAKGNWVLTVMSGYRDKPFEKAIAGYSVGKGALELDMDQLNPTKEINRNKARLSQFIDILEVGGRYQLSFEARASEAGSILRVAVGLVVSGMGKTEGGLDLQQVDLDTEFKPSHFEFQGTEIVSDKADPQKFTRVEFRLGEALGKVSLRNVRLVHLD